MGRMTSVTRLHIEVRLAGSGEGRRKVKYARRQCFQQFDIKFEVNYISLMNYISLKRVRKKRKEKKSKK